MKYVLSAEQTRLVDQATQQSTPISTLIERAGYAVASEAIAMLKGAYGKRIVVVAGRGHNGDDGRVAAEVLRRRGAHVDVVDVGSSRQVPIVTDLVIDAAFGTGFHGSYVAPRVPQGVSVLAVDLASGLDADNGTACEGAVIADVTVTFGTAKPGHFLAAGPAHSGRLSIVDIGLLPTTSELVLVEDGDLADVPARRRDGHKWDTALYVVAGSPNMLGAAALTCTGALRSGAGMVRLGAPGVEHRTPLVTEVVAATLPASGFARDVLAALVRCKALVVGPGLGTGQPVVEAICELVQKAPVPTVVDADALNALATRDDWRKLCRDRAAPAILTPHEGEFERLAGERPGTDRLAAARALAKDSGAIVLLKGAPTIVASPDGATQLVTAGTARLSTAGSGDVLSGVIGAFLARGLEPSRAAGLGAQVHGLAAQAGIAEGLIASDLPTLVARVLSGERHSRRRGRRHGRRPQWRR